MAILRFINIIIAAILAGVSFAIWKGYSPYGWGPVTYVRQQQHMLSSLRILMILLVITAIIVTLISAILQRKNKVEFISLLLATAMFITCLLITRFGNKPIDDIIMTWNSSAVPDGWTLLRDKWWSLHKMRTATELIALVLITWTSIRKD